MPRIGQQPPCAKPGTVKTCRSRQGDERAQAGDDPVSSTPAGPDRPPGPLPSRRPGGVGGSPTVGAVEGQDGRPDDSARPGRNGRGAGRRAGPGQFAGGDGEVGLERRIGFRAANRGGAHDAAGLDVAGVVDAADGSAVAIGQPARQDLVGPVGAIRTGPAPRPSPGPNGRKDRNRWPSATARVRNRSLPARSRRGAGARSRAWPGSGSSPGRPASAPAAASGSASVRVRRRRPGLVEHARRGGGLDLVVGARLVPAGGPLQGAGGAIIGQASCALSEPASGGGGRKAAALGAAAWSR